MPNVPFSVVPSRVEGTKGDPGQTPCLGFEGGVPSVEAVARSTSIFYIS